MTACARVVSRASLPLQNSVNALAHCVVVWGATPPKSSLWKCWLNASYMSRVPLLLKVGSKLWRYCLSEQTDPPAL